MPLVQKQITECKYCCKSIIADKYECESCYDKRQTIKVVKLEYYVRSDYQFMATIGDYDLDCKTGLGESEEDAIDDLMYKTA